MVTLDDMANALNLKPQQDVKGFEAYGEVKSINADGTYQVSLNGSTTTVKCARLAGAHVGDVVLVTVLNNGYAVVTGCVGGDTDALEAKAAADGTAQHFWTDEDGAHITEVTKEEYERDPENAGGNLLARSTGVEIKSSTDEYGNIPYVMNVGSNNIAIYADGSDLEDTRTLTITNVDESSEIKSVYSPILGTQDIGAITFGQYAEGLVLSYTRRSTGGQRRASLSILPGGVSIDKILSLESDLTGPLITPTVDISLTTGTMDRIECHRFGQIVQMTLTYHNTAAVNAGSNVITGTLNTTSLRPAASYVTGAGYSGTRSLAGSISSAGAIVIRNNVSQLPANTTTTMSFTYLIA